MDGVGGYEGWRWLVTTKDSFRPHICLNHLCRIFIIEGLLTVVVAFSSFWLIAPWPEDAKFLSADEKALLTRRLAADRGHAKVQTLTVAAFVDTLTDWKIWIGWVYSSAMR